MRSQKAEKIGVASTPCCWNGKLISFHVKMISCYRCSDRLMSYFYLCEERVVKMKANSFYKVTPCVLLIQDPGWGSITISNQSLSGSEPGQLAWTNRFELRAVKNTQSSNNWQLKRPQQHHYEMIMANGNFWNLSMQHLQRKDLFLLHFDISTKLATSTGLYTQFYCKAMCLRQRFTQRKASSLTMKGQRELVSYPAWQWNTTAVSAQVQKIFT